MILEREEINLHLKKKVNILQNGLEKIKIGWALADQELRDQSERVLNY